jgi:hypothetical protein
MKASCKIIIDFDNVEKVKTVIRSIKVDDFDFVKTRAIEKRLEACIKSNSISSLLNTLDDYLACVSIADRVVDKS